MEPRSQLVDMYLGITKDCSINQLGPPFRYYYSDITESNIMAKNVLLVDVKAAFPTICKILFGPDHQFVKNIFAIDDKFLRNKYISTTLKEQSQIDGYEYIGELNLWSKMLVLTYVYAKYENINILEFVKDGILFGCEVKEKYSNEDNSFLKFTKDHQIIYHEDIVPIYLRFNKTSIYQIKDTETNKIKLQIKGVYNSPPSALYEIIVNLLNGRIYDLKYLQEIKKIYSSLYFNIVFKSHLADFVKACYEFEEKRYLDSDRKITKNISEICPQSYLTEIIYPILSLLRLDRARNKM